MTLPVSLRLNKRTESSPVRHCNQLSIERQFSDAPASTTMTNYLALPAGERAPDEVNVVIEIPRGQTNKYEYDKQLHVFRLDRNLYSPVHYPGDYGFIPRTLSDDGDPLDALVDAPSFTGCLMTVRPIGMLEMIDQGIGDEKILAVGINNPIYKD